ncbi:MAG TPA: hypothetical protein VH989_07445 [Actinomycetota bacterium]|jgi:hypothetical protein
MSARLYGKSTGGSLGGIALVTGLVGSVASAMLWLHEVNPSGGVTRFVAQKVLGTSDGWTALVTIAAVAGGLGLLVAILGTIGSRRSGGAVFGVVLSLIALSYPFAYAAQLVARPFTGGHGLLGA